MNDQPDWLKETVAGLTTSHKFRVFLDGVRYAVIVCPGHTGYLNRMQGSKYCPVTYTLVEKGKNYWSHTWKDLHVGRATRADKIRMEKQLVAAEGKATS